MVSKPSRTWLPVGFAMLVVGWGANQFSPMLLVYRAELGFSAGELALLFGLYAIGLIPGLLIGGPASDRYGRRALVLPFVALSPLASLLLVLAHHSPAGLGAARLLAGACSGVVFAAAGAWIQELSTDAAPGAASRRAAVSLSLGFGIGPLVAALIAQWAPAPLELPYLPQIALGVLSLVLVWAVPETVRRGAASGPLLRLPSTARLGRFQRAVVPVAPWVFGSASLSLVVLPAQVSSVDSASVAFAGVVTALTLGSGVLVQPVARRIEERRRLAAAAVGLLAAAAALAIGLEADDAGSKALVLVAAIPFGIAYGTCLVSGLRETERLAPAGERGASIAVFLALTYLGFGAPYAFNLLAGLTDASTTLTLGVAFALLTALWIWRQSRPDVEPAPVGMVSAGASGGRPRT
jgi:predicted MFS family arabinose efflux permease